MKRLPSAGEQGMDFFLRQGMMELLSCKPRKGWNLKIWAPKGKGEMSTRTTNFLGSKCEFLDNFRRGIGNQWKSIIFRSNKKNRVIQVDFFLRENRVKSETFFFFK